MSGFPCRKNRNEKIINNCQECPACYQATGMCVYECAKTGESLGYNDNFIAIPEHCPLKNWTDNMPLKKVVK